MPRSRKMGTHAKSSLGGPGLAANGLWFEERPGAVRTAAKWFFLLLVCAYFGFCYGSHPSFLDLKLYTQGQAGLPYQYRILPMYIFRALLRVPLVLKLAAHVPPLGNDPYRLIMAGIGFAGMLGALLATRGTLTRLTGDRVYSFWAALLLAFMALVDLASSWDNPFTTPYDVPSLMFFALCIYLVLRRSWWVYYPIFVLAVFNRETACFITVFFAVWEWVRLEQLGTTVARRLQWIVPNVSMQTLIWIAIKVWLAHHFAGNPTEKTAEHANGLFLTHFTYNLKELFKVFQWPLYASICGFSLPFLWLQRRWIQCRGLALALAVILPLSFIGLIIVGVIVEIRIFSEWIALVSVAVALILFHRFRPVQG